MQLTALLDHTDIVTAACRALPCHDSEHADVWFAESPGQVEQAKAMCQPCPVKTACLRGALRRSEPWGVWGGELFADGRIVPRKRPRGRPRKHPVAETEYQPAQSEVQAGAA